MCVYLLHFDRRISDRHSCQHYVGFADDVDARLALHRAGQGARLTQVAVERGIGFVVARVWPGGTRALERQIKRRKHAPDLCPLCSGVAAYRRCVPAGEQGPLARRGDDGILEQHILEKGHDHG